MEKHAIRGAIVRMVGWDSPASPTLPSNVVTMETADAPGPVWRHVLHAVSLPLAGVGLQVWLNPYVQSRFLFLYHAVFLSAWIGGFRWGILSTVFATGLAWYFMIPPKFSFAM